MLLLAMLLALALQAPGFTVSGTVSDSSGGVIAGALVRVEATGGTQTEVWTLADGTFSIQLASPPVRLRVSKEGFADRVLQFVASSSGLQIQLAPARLTETATIMAGKPRLGGPFSITTIQAAELSDTPALMLDDQLRTIPGFSLFRRSSSRVANPTTQGVTMRGLAASGASRSVVVADDLPLNDPFGGWVYWNRIPIAAIESIDVRRGGAGDLFGSDAMGGAIEITSQQGSGGRVWIDGGSHGAARVSAYTGSRSVNWLVNGAIEASTSDGFVVVAPESRGPIDTDASQRYFSGHGGGFFPAGEVILSGQGNYFSEDRGNGTPFQSNSTIVRQIGARAVGGAWNQAWTARFSGTSQDYDQTFSAIAADRASERPTTIQHVDTESLDAVADWEWSSTGKAIRGAGSFRQVRSDLSEAPALGNAPVALTGVTQRTTAAWAQGSFILGYNLTVGGGVRLENWRSERRDHANGRSVTRVLPRASVAWQFASAASLRVAGQHSYRTPTINELYRGFRVGNVLTQANAALEPETLTGGEVSLVVRATGTTLRTIGFWTRLDDAIVNVTLESGPALILRQRQNAGRIRATGVEVEIDAPLAPTLSVQASTAFVDSVFTEGAALDGLRVPQVPRWQTSAGAHGAWRQLAYSVDWRFIGSQYDDDRNEFELGPSTMVNARVGWRVRRREVFAAIENVLDEEQDVGRTPVRTIGLPRTSRVGVRWEW
jgi:outer membrane receptor protein involved in Fe transport